MLLDDEAFEERAAIMEYDGGVSRAEAEAAAREDMHRCEIAWCLRKFYPDGTAMAAHFELVEKKRGKSAADRLREDVREAWRAKRADA